MPSHDFRSAITTANAATGVSVPVWVGVEPQAQLQKQGDTSPPWMAFFGVPPKQVPARQWRSE